MVDMNMQDGPLSPTDDALLENYLSLQGTGSIQMNVDILSPELSPENFWDFASTTASQESHVQDTLQHQTMLLHQQRMQLDALKMKNQLLYNRLRVSEKEHVPASAGKQAKFAGHVAEASRQSRGTLGSQFEFMSPMIVSDTMVTDLDEEDVSATRLSCSVILSAP
jgi:hypothetical protein